MSKRPFPSVSLGRQKFVRRSAGSNMFYAIANGNIIGRNLVDDRVRQLLRDRYNLMMEWIRQTLRYFAPFDVTRRLQYTMQLIGVQWIWRARPPGSTNITLGSRSGNPPFLWVAHDRVAHDTMGRGTVEIYPSAADIASYNDIASDALTALGYH